METSAAPKSLSIRKLAIVGLGFALIPVVGWVVLTHNIASLDRLAKNYECYPVNQCSFDLNTDGALDRIEISDEPTPDDRSHSRLKIYVSGALGQPDLNIENVHVDNTFRTHIAYLEESGIKKIVVYDTANPQQFFHWDGSRLSATEQPSELERRIHDAMALGDDTGGFHRRIVFELGFAAFCVVYYFVLILVIAIYLLRRRSGTTKI